MLRELFRRRGVAAPGRTWMMEVLRQCKHAQVSATVSVDRKILASSDTANVRTLLIEVIW